MSEGKIFRKMLLFTENCYFFTCAFSLCRSPFSLSQLLLPPTALPWAIQKPHPPTPPVVSADPDHLQIGPTPPM